MDLILDTETASTVDLARCGAQAYARAGDTRVLLLGLFAVGEAPPRAAPPDAWDPAAVRALLARAERIVVHNATFDTSIWAHHLADRFGPLPEARIVDTAAACRRAGLRAGLSEAGAALGLSTRKDAAGHEHMRRLARPDRRGGWSHHTPAALAQLARYCEQDLAATAELLAALPAWALDPGPEELAVERWTRRACERGIGVDLPLAALVAEAREYCASRAGDAYRSPQRVVDALREAGVAVPDASEQTLAPLLEHTDPRVRGIVAARLAVAASATSKADALLQRLASGRIRDHLQYYGAHTGRWTSTGAQLQNLPRDATETDLEVEAVSRRLETLLAEQGDPRAAAELASRLVRATLAAPFGRVLVRADLAQIEARVLLWLAAWAAGADPAQTLAPFLAGDPYRAFAARVFGVAPEAVTKAQRQLGKAAVLGLGYGMGATRFAATCSAAYGIPVDAALAERVVRCYRAEFGVVVRLWRAAEYACRSAVRALRSRLRGAAAGEWHQVGRAERLAYTVREPHWVALLLPSGRLLAYFQPDEHAGELVFDSPRGRAKLYGGLLVENLTQAVARDLLAHAILRLEADGWQVVHTVHDELVVECDERDAARAQAAVLDALRTPPAWAKAAQIPDGLLDATAQVGRHYGK